LVIELLRMRKTGNLIATLELFQDNFTTLLEWLKKIKFL
jgi:hypothetical protein